VCLVYLRKSLDRDLYDCIYLYNLLRNAGTFFCKGGCVLFFNVLTVVGAIDLNTVGDSFLSPSLMAMGV
jgi:hypothetical protein